MNPKGFIIIYGDLHSVLSLDMLLNAIFRLSFTRPYYERRRKEQRRILFAYYCDTNKGVVVNSRCHVSFN